MILLTHILLCKLFLYGDDLQYVKNFVIHILEIHMKSFTLAKPCDGTRSENSLLMVHVEKWETI